MTEALLVNEQEARRMLGGVCAKSMFNLRKAGLPYIKLGSRTMYDPQDLAVYVAKLKVRTGGEAA